MAAACRMHRIRRWLARHLAARAVDAYSKGTVSSSFNLAFSKVAKADYGTCAPRRSLVGSHQEQEGRALLLGDGQCGQPRPWGGKKTSRRFARGDRFLGSRSKPPPERVDLPQRQPGTGKEQPLTQLDASGLDNRSRAQSPVPVEKAEFFPC